MLGKVMKYEFRALGRLLLPLFGLALGVGALLRILYLLSGLIWAPAQTVMSGISTAFGAIAAFGVVAIAFVAVVARFYQSMVAAEGYLTFTLPVKPSTHIWARVWVGLVYTTLSVVAAFALVFIAIEGFWASFVHELLNPTINVSGMGGGSRLIPLAPGQAGLLYCMVIGILILTLLVALSQFYASVALGTSITQNRVVGGILGFIILNTIESVVSLPFIILPMALSIGFKEEEWMAWIQRWFNGTDAEIISQTLRLVVMILALTFVVNLLFAAAHYILTKHFFTKKLNLE